MTVEADVMLPPDELPEADSVEPLMLLPVNTLPLPLTFGTLSFWLAESGVSRTAIGVVVGNIPILGVSTILCTAIALGFRLNLAAIQLTQALMAPSQLLLIIPFVLLGE